MPWIKRSDTAAMAPMVLAPMAWTDEEDGLDPTDRVNLLNGFIQRCVDQCASYEQDYRVDVATVMLCGGPNWARRAQQAERAGYWTRLDDGRGWLIVDDEDNFVHMRLKAEVEWERQRKRDNSNPELIVPVRVRDGDACRYCSAVVNWSARKGGRAGTYHHRRRPASGPEDLVVACKSCNSTLGTPTGSPEKLEIQPPPEKPFYGADTVALLAKHGVTVELSAARPGSQPDPAPRDPKPGTPRHNGQPARDPAPSGTTRPATPPSNTRAGHRAAGQATPPDRTDQTGHRSRDPQPRTPRQTHKPAQQSKSDGGLDPPRPDLPDPADSRTPKSGLLGTGRDRDGTEAPPAPPPTRTQPNSRARRRRARRAKPTVTREGKTLSTDDDDQERSDALDQLAQVISSLREAWGWLGELTEPGRYSMPTPILTDAQRARIAKAVREERADRAAVKATGLGPLTERLSVVGAGALGHAPAGARLTVLDASTVVRAIVVDVAESVAAGGFTARPGGGGFYDALSLLERKPRWIASTRGVIGRVTYEGTRRLSWGEIIAITESLNRALDVAYIAAGITGDFKMAFPLPCPACGRRSLQWEMPSADERTWSVHCVRDKCRCTGPGCPCLHSVRYPGRRHAWARGELDGIWGLKHAIGMASKPRPRIRSRVAGHGGWQERR